MPKPYTSDLNADRCVYQEHGHNRTYVITRQDGHTYNGAPAKITVTDNIVTCTDILGKPVEYPPEAVDIYFVRGSGHHDTRQLTDLSFTSIFPHLAQQISYRWLPGTNVRQVFHEE